jgi:PAS domain S-box-containing protein
MSSGIKPSARDHDVDPLTLTDDRFTSSDAESVLRALAGLSVRDSAALSGAFIDGGLDQEQSSSPTGDGIPILEAQYRTLLEQMSAIVFMAYLDRGIGEAYVSPQIEASLGFSQQEWLEDPVRWYLQIHEDDKQRWSIEAAEMFLLGKPLRSVYRVRARDGRVVWFHCQARTVRRDDGRPWFIQGVAFDVTDLKQTEAALQEERNVISTILDTVGALVVVLDPEGRVARFNRACELTTGYEFERVRGRTLWHFFPNPEELEGFKDMIAGVQRGDSSREYEAIWMTRAGAARRILWTSTIVARPDGSTEYVIATGIDVTEPRRLQKAILEIADEEERRVGQDLHDGLGQHLTGIAFMSKVLEQKLADQSLPESADARKILTLVNEAITKTRELARGLLPVVSDHHGLMSALKQIASDVEDLFGITCRFECDEPVVVSDPSAATQLCRVAREAVNNAIKHGRAREVVISLSASGESGTLIVQDDGVGFPKRRTIEAGMGLHIMRYRASIIGGSLQVEPGGNGNTAITCTFPVNGRE